MFQDDRSILVAIRHPVPVRLPDRQGRPRYAYATLTTPCSIPSVPKTALARLWRTGAGPFGHKFDDGRWDYYHEPVIPAVQAGREVNRLSLGLLTDALQGRADPQGGWRWQDREFRRTPLTGNAWRPLVEPWLPGIDIGEAPDPALARIAVERVRAYARRHLRHDGRGLLRLNQPIQLHMDGKGIVGRTITHGAPGPGEPGLRLGAEDVRLRAFYGFLGETRRWGRVAFRERLPRNPKPNPDWDLDVEEYVNAAPAWLVQALLRAEGRSGSGFAGRDVHDRLAPLLEAGLVRGTLREGWPEAIVTIADAAFEAAGILPEGERREDARLVGLYGRMVAAPSFPTLPPAEEDIAALELA